MAMTRIWRFGPNPEWPAGEWWVLDAPRAPPSVVPDKPWKPIGAATTLVAAPKKGRTCVRGDAELVGTEYAFFWVPQRVVHTVARDASEVWRRAAEAKLQALRRRVRITDPRREDLVRRACEQRGSTSSETDEADIWVTDVVRRYMTAATSDDPAQHEIHPEMVLAQLIRQMMHNDVPFAALSRSDYEGERDLIRRQFYEDIERLFK